MTTKFISYFFHRIASINMQTRQMLWPLRVYDNFVIANSATPVWESEGFVYIWDRRLNEYCINC